LVRTLEAAEVRALYHRPIVLRDRSRTLRDQRMLGTGDVELFAEGRAPCVVGLHGFSGSAAELRPVLDAIASAGFAVDAALLAGHGARVEQLQELHFDGWVEGARARMAIARERYGRVVLLGFSLGSLVAMQLASEEPEGLVGFVAMGNAITLSASMRIPMSAWCRTGMRMPDLYLLKPFAGDLVDPSGMDALVTYDRHPLRAALEVYRAGRRVRDVVSRIKCPTLVLHGRRDRVCPWTNATWLAHHVGSREVGVRIFERSGHVLACDGERDEVSREVLAFLNHSATVL
jgi:carboxylesterase